MNLLQVFPCSQAHVDQRKGRAGRISSGICFRLFTENAYFSEMLAIAVPEIQRINLSKVILILKSFNVDNIFELELMDIPPKENLAQSMFRLWILNALDENGNLTVVGKKMIEFPIKPNLAKIIILAKDMGCSREVVTIVSMLSVPSIFSRSTDLSVDPVAVRNKLHVLESDHLTLLNIYLQWKKK